MFMSLAGIVMLGSCTKNDSLTTTSDVTIISKASTTAPTLKSSLVTGNTVELTDLIVNVKEIKFDFDDENGHGKECKDHKEHKDHMRCSDDQDSIYSDQKLYGPFVLHLLDSGVALQQTLTTVELPNTAYEEVKFKLSPDTPPDAPEEIKNRSVYMAGTVNGMPFVMWHNAKIKVKVEFPDSASFTLDSPEFYLFIDAHIDRIMAGLQEIDLSGLSDGNNDGVIEIGPGDPDGNSKYADYLIHYIKKSFDLDDDDDNGNDHHNGEMHGHGDHD